MLIKDSNGRPSWHVTIGVPALIVGTVTYLLGGLVLTLPGGFHLTMPERSGTEYLLFVGPWLSALGFRDYRLNKEPK